MKALVQGDETDDDHFFLDTLFIGNLETLRKSINGMLQSLDSMTHV